MLVKLYKDYLLQNDVKEEQIIIIELDIVKNEDIITYRNMR